MSPVVQGLGFFNLITYLLRLSAFFYMERFFYFSFVQKSQNSATTNATDSDSDDNGLGGLVYYIHLVHQLLFPFLCIVISSEIREGK